MSDIVLSRVDFSYPKRPVLQNFSLTVADGDFVALVGPNGAGKTTALKIMAGLLKPQAGAVLSDGKPIEHLRSEGGIGYVPQNYGNSFSAFPATVEEVVRLGLLNTRTASETRQAMQHIVGHMLELVGAADLRDCQIGELSGGQQQRVMVARALAGNPELLLLDEPTSGIDYAASTQIFDLLGRLNQNLGITVVMVSHDLDKALKCSTKVACINRGLCFFGDSDTFARTHLNDRHLWYYGS